MKWARVAHRVVAHVLLLAMSVVLVTGSYDREIRFWEAWSGICSRTIGRSGETGVSICQNRTANPP